MKKLLVFLFLCGIAALSLELKADTDIKTTSPNVKLIGADGQELEGVAGSTNEIKLFEKVLEYAKTLTESETITAIRNYTFEITVTPDADTPPVVVIPDPVACGEGYTGFEPDCVPVVVSVDPYADWNVIALENEVFTLPSGEIHTVVYGTNTSWLVIPDVQGGQSINCNSAFAGSDPLVGQGKECRSIKTGDFVEPEPEPEPEPIVYNDAYCATVEPVGTLVANGTLTGCMNKIVVNQPATGLPAVDISKNMTPLVGDSTLNIVPATHSYGQHSGTNSGEFRVNCKVSHMSNDDPIVYPNQEGAAHHHTFWGNTSVKYDSDIGAMETVGNSTCSGGIANRAAYWAPTMIDTATNTPIEPVGVSTYYKTDRASDVTVAPKGLRMVAKTYSKIEFSCNDGYPDQVKLTREIPACPQGGRLSYGVEFGNCWDGINLDSPDHQAHMVKAGIGDACPASHPVRIPNIQVNLAYIPDTPAGTTNWRLSSDPLDAVAGSTAHADWVNGWDEAVAATWVENCLKAERDCHADLLGDGNMLHFNW